MFSRNNSSCIMYAFLFFTERANIQKLKIGTSVGRLRDPAARRPGDQMMGRSNEVQRASFKHTCKIQLTSTLDLL